MNLKWSRFYYTIPADGLDEVMKSPTYYLQKLLFVDKDHSRSKIRFSSKYCIYQLVFIWDDKITLIIFEHIKLETVILQSVIWDHIYNAKKKAIEMNERLEKAYWDKVYKEAAQKRIDNSLNTLDIKMKIWLQEARNKK